MLPFKPLSQFIFQFVFITSTALGKAFIQVMHTSIHIYIDIINSRIPILTTYKPFLC